MGSEASGELVFDQRRGHRVVMATDLNVVVDVDPHQFPRGVCLGHFGERPECWAIECLAQTVPATGECLKGPGVEIDP